jgi:hypothetical protein
LGSGGVTGFGAVTHPASAAARHAPAASHRATVTPRRANLPALLSLPTFDRSMWLLLLEALLALAILLFIVWWTWPKKK